LLVCYGLNEINCWIFIVSSLRDFL
jgi:hypothetical protein